MIDLFIIILLAIGFIMGAKRGVIVQGMHVASMVISIIVALIFYKSLAEKFVFWVPYPSIESTTKTALDLSEIDIDGTFYQIFAFALLYFTVKLIVKLIITFFDHYAYLPAFESTNRIVGGLLGLVEYYMTIFIVLYLLALLSFEFLVARMQNSILGKLIVEYTPGLTQLMQKWWYVYS